MLRREFIRTLSCASVMASAVPLNALANDQLTSGSIKIQLQQAQQGVLARLGQFLKSMNPVNPGLNDSNSVFSQSQQWNIYHQPIAAAKNATSLLAVIHESDNAVVIYDENFMQLQRINMPNDFGYLSDVTFDSQDNMYVADSVKHTIYKLDGHGNLLTTIGEFGLAQHQLNGPKQLTIDSNDNLHVINIGDRSVKVFSAQGQYLFQYLDGYVASDVAASGSGEIVVSSRRDGTLIVLNEKGQQQGIVELNSVLEGQRQPVRLSFEGKQLLVTLA